MSPDEIINRLGELAETGTGILRDEDASPSPAENEAYGLLRQLQQLAYHLDNPPGNAVIQNIIDLDYLLGALLGTPIEAAYPEGSPDDLRAAARGLLQKIRQGFVVGLADNQP